MIAGTQITDGGEGVPEGDGDASIVRVLKDPGHPPILNQMPDFATKLEFFSDIINGPGTVCLHEDAALHLLDHVL